MVISAQENGSDEEDSDGGIPLITEDGRNDSKNLMVPLYK